MVVPLPVGEPDPLRRLQLITAQTAERKKKARPPVTSGIFQFAAAQRALCRRLPRQRYMNVSLSNVPGPPVPPYLAGRRCSRCFPWCRS
jgi:diacylglycerol O-acyltransferase / wax synthase